MAGLGRYLEGCVSGLEIYKSPVTVSVFFFGSVTSLLSGERVKNAEALEPVEFKDGETVEREGDKGDQFFIVTDASDALRQLVVIVVACQILNELRLACLNALMSIRNSILAMDC